MGESFWVEWHKEYDSLTSHLSVRRRTVESFLTRALVLCDGGAPTILSLCAGDGRDVANVLAASAPGRVGRATLVELNPQLADRARAANAAHPEVEVRTADAGRLSAIADCVPADVLVLSGVLGNLATASLPPCIERLHAVVRPGGLVVWTRGRAAPDPRPWVRKTFVGAGFEEHDFRGEPAPFGVGLSRADPARVAPPVQRVRPRSGQEARASHH